MKTLNGSQAENCSGLAGAGAAGLDVGADAFGVVAALDFKAVGVIAGRHIVAVSTAKVVASGPIANTTTRHYDGTLRQ